MKKETFSIIIVPHDLKKTRTYRVPYRLFYVFIALISIAVVAVVVFITTYAKLLVKARDTVMLERQVVELTRRNEQIGEIARNMTEVHAMELQVKRMLGVEVSHEDSLAIQGASLQEEQADIALQDENSQMLRAIPSSWPVKGYITKGYNVTGGEEDPSYHAGIDIGVERGTPVRAAAAGYVVNVGWDDAYGYYVRLDHGYGIKTLYGHNERLVVIEGERVGRGQTIAYSGSTGRSTAPHLHFEVTKNSIPVDPLKYLMR